MAVRTILTICHRLAVSEYSYRLRGLSNEPRNAPVANDPAERKHFGRHDSNRRWSCCVIVLFPACVRLVLCFVFVVVMQKNYPSFDG